jgi:hypothetical protein
MVVMAGEAVVRALTRQVEAGARGERGGLLGNELWVL